MQDEQNAAAANEVVSLRPTFYGVGVDLKEAGRKIKRWFRRTRAPSLSASSVARSEA
jgi:hypothetical protein